MAQRLEIIEAPMETQPQLTSQRVDHGPWARVYCLGSSPFLAYSLGFRSAFVRFRLWDFNFGFGAESGCESSALGVSGSGAFADFGPLSAGFLMVAKEGVFGQFCCAAIVRSYINPTKNVITPYTRQQNTHGTLSFDPEGLLGLPDLQA